MLTTLTMKIESLATHPDRAGRYTLRLEDGSVLRLYRQTLESFPLYKGAELTPSELDDLYKAAGEMSAKMRAVRIVAASAVSKADLERRLIQKGEDKEQAKQAVQWMSELELIDDRDTAQQIVNRCIRKGYGAARAKQALYEKRIPKEYWDDVLSDYPDQSRHILAFLRTRLGDSRDKKDIQKATGSLLQRGHSYLDIQRCLRQICEDDEYLEDNEWQT